MSWDIFAQDIPFDAQTIDDIPDTFVPGRIGKRSEIIGAIKQVVPFAVFSNPAWGTIDGNGFSIEVSIGDEEDVGCVAFHVSGDSAAAAIISDILTHLNLRAFDMGTGDIFDHSTAAAGMDRWRAYRDSVLSRDDVGG